MLTRTLKSRFTIKLFSSIKASGSPNSLGKQASNIHGAHSSHSAMKAAPLTLEELLRKGTPHGEKDLNRREEFESKVVVANDEDFLFVQSSVDVLGPIAVKYHPSIIRAHKCNGGITNSDFETSNTIRILKAYIRTFSRFVNR